MNRNRKYRAVSTVLTLILAIASAASAEWKEKVLYSFQGGTNDGAVPVGGVVFDKQGNIYGALQGYGSGSCTPIGNDCGAVYQLSPPAQKGGAWTEALIYEFQGKGANDGELPNSGLIMDKAGNLYGVTAYGGTGNCTLLGVAAGCGTVYELSPPQQQGGAWTETILYSFPTTKQGYLPNGNLVLDKAGNLYGATTFGGTKDGGCNGFYGGQCGVIFELSPPKKPGGAWTEKTLHSFANIPDGAEPNGGLILDSKGTIYGTTYYGGYNCPHNSNQGCGTAFELQPPTKKGGEWMETVLHRFKRDSSDGGDPMAGLRFDVAGYLYGTTLNGGPGQYGTVFCLRPPSKGARDWVETVLYGFGDGQQGADPEAGLIFDAHGDLYGTALGGETHGGVVFRLKPPKRGDSWPLTVLYNFTKSPDADHPTAGLVFDAKGNLYSTTEWGGTGQTCQGGCGTVFEISP
ncbi:MAG: choice-of-anchor tandem repeat GloVer-containing protein [Terriglobales bacterium]